MKPIAINNISSSKTHTPLLISRPSRRSCPKSELTVSVSLFSLSHTHTHTNWNAALRSISITIKTKLNRNSFQHSTRRRTRKKLCFFQKWECWESRGVSARGSPKLREWKPPFSPARVWRWPESPLPQVRFPVPVSWSTGIFFWPLMWIFRLLLLRRLPRSASKTASLQLSFLTGFQFFPFFIYFYFSFKMCLFLYVCWNNLSFSVLVEKWKNLWGRSEWKLGEGCF